VGADLPVATIINFIIGDFESAWDAIAHLPGPIPRGNFLFAMQVLTLLEVACRLCKQDKKAHQDFSKELAKRDPRYFTPLPGVCQYPKEFDLPSQSATPACELIAVLFDLIRNGQAHQYQQIRVELEGKKNFQFSLTGAEHQLYLHRSFAGGRPAQHLAAQVDEDGDIWITVCTDILFLDIRDSIRAANLLDRKLTLEYLKRPKYPRHYKFTAGALEQCLRLGGHWQ
jgi:hypothetical protein